MFLHSRLLIKSVFCFSNTEICYMSVSGKTTDRYFVTLELYSSHMASQSP